MENNLYNEKLENFLKWAIMITGVRLWCNIFSSSKKNYNTSFCIPRDTICKKRHKSTCKPKSNLLFDLDQCIYIQLEHHIQCLWTCPCWWTQLCAFCTTPKTHSYFLRFLQIWQADYLQHWKYIFLQCLCHP